jgi:hypothetical protein
MDAANEIYSGRLGLFPLAIFMALHLRPSQVGSGSGMIFVIDVNGADDATDNAASTSSTLR